ncbi:hypothetical protein ACFLZM_07525 [Thermodesulfobacteriota bacterium]
MDFPFGLMMGLLVTFLSDQATPYYKGAPIQITPSAVMTKVSSNPVHIPKWVSLPPKDCFVGISKPCQSIEKARDHALNSAITQILQAMGAKYNLSHESVLSGDLNHSRYNLKERLNFTANWFLKSIQQNIKEVRIIPHENGYLCFVLVKLSPSDLQLLRKLTIGPKVTATATKVNATQLMINAKEINDVGVALTGYEISTYVKNHHAGLITLFAWKVLEGSTENFSGVLEQSLHLKKSSAKTTIRIRSQNDSLKSIILGTETITTISLTGHDEIGRFTSVPVKVHQ